MLELRNVLNTKLNKKGFTLAELLVVVAIIAILVAISIPIFSGRLEKARKATDMANLRAAKAAAVTEYLSAEATDTLGDMYYDINKGVLVSASESLEGYNEAKQDSNLEPKTAIIKATFAEDTTDEDGNATPAEDLVKVEWVAVQ